MRKRNIENFNDYRRTSHYNPLFDKITNAFDYFILERGMSDEFMLENLYVDERTEDIIVSRRLYELWHKRPQTISRGGNIHANIQKDENAGLVYLLLGKKGTGKTITLKHFSYDIKKTESKTGIVNVIYLDLVTDRGDKSFLENIPNTLIKRIYDTIKKDEYEKKMGDLSDYLTCPSQMRRLDTLYESFDDAEIARRILDNKHKAIQDLFKLLQSIKYETYLIIDNIDDFPKKAVENIINMCCKLMQDYKLKCIIALRDYWNPQSLDFSDRYICSYYLTKPDIFKILEQRLALIPEDNIKDGCEVKYKKQDTGEWVSITLEPKDIIDTLRRSIKNITQEKAEHEKLYKLANYNVREHLHNIYHFFHSPYLYSKPMFLQSIIEIIKKTDDDYIGETRKVKFFDFIECAMAVHALCYDEKASKIFNMFCHEHNYGNDDYNYRNTLIYVRILQSIRRRANAKQKVIDNLEAVGYNGDALRRAIDKLLEKALIESIEGATEEYAKEISISGKGIIYLDELINEYIYLLFVCDAVPMPSHYQEDIIEKFGNNDVLLSRGGNLSTKHKSVTAFVNFIRSEEQNEKEHCPEDKQDFLEEIREGGIATRMGDCVEQTIRKMNAGQKDIRNTQKPEDFKFTNKEEII